MARILIADDSSIVREPIAAALEQAGHTVVTATNGREALIALRAQRPDVLLLDLSMPVLDGFGVLAELAKDESNRIAVVVMTEAADRVSIARAGRLGVRHYLSKSSFSMDTLLERVKAALASTRGDHPRPTGNRPQLSVEATTMSSKSGEGEPPVSTIGAVQALAVLKPLLTRSELEKRLSVYSDLKAFPPVVSEVVRLCKAPQTSTESLSQAIRKDPAIAVRVLRLANSAAYATGSPVQTVEQAVVRVGVQALGQAVLSVGVVDRFSALPDGMGLDAQLFWEHSIGVGLIAARLAGALKCMSPETAFTMGLIHDIGRLILAGALGDEYLKVLRTSRELCVPVEVAEKRLLTVTHADCMNRTLAGWGFPRELTDPVSLHHCDLTEMQAKAPKRWKEVAVLALADRLCHAMVLGSSGNETIYDLRELCTALGVPDTLLTELQAKVREETLDLKLAMLATGVTPTRATALGRTRTVLGESFNIGCICLVPGPEALAIFLGNVCEASADPIAVVVIADAASDAGDIAESISRLEVDHGGHKLPLIALRRDSGQPPPTVPVDRPVCDVVLPVTIDGLAKGLRALGSGEVTRPSMRQAA